MTMLVKKKKERRSGQAERTEAARSTERKEGRRDIHQKEVSACQNRQREEKAIVMRKPPDRTHER